MDWIKQNWQRIAKYGGLGVGCLVVGLLAFVFARYLGSGAEYEGGLLELAPADVSMVTRIDNVPNRKFEIEQLLDHVLARPEFIYLEASSLWRDSLGKRVGGSLEDFRRETMHDALQNAQRGADQAGAELFEDVLGGEARVLEDPPTLVNVSELGDSSVNLLVRAWTVAGDFFDTKLDLTRAIKERLDAEKISIPFPQRDIHVLQN
jgi:hypothetical protein